MKVHFMTLNPPNWIMLAAWVKRHVVVLLTRFHKYLSSRANISSIFFPWALRRFVATVQSFGDLESRDHWLVKDRRHKIKIIAWKPFVVLTLFYILSKNPWEECNGSMLDSCKCSKSRLKRCTQFWYRKFLGNADQSASGPAVISGNYRKCRPM